MRDINSPVELLTLQQAAERMGVSARFVRSQAKARRIATVRLGRLVRFQPKALDDYVDASTTRVDALGPDAPAEA